MKKKLLILFILLALLFIIVQLSLTTKLFISGNRNGFTIKKVKLVKESIALFLEDIDWVNEDLILIAYYGDKERKVHKGIHIIDTDGNLVRRIDVGEMIPSEFEVNYYFYSISPNRREIAYIKDGREIKIYDVSKDKIRSLVEFSGYISNIRWSVCGKKIAFLEVVSKQRGRMGVIDLRSKEIKRSLDDIYIYINSRKIVWDELSGRIFYPVKNVLYVMDIKDLKVRKLIEINEEDRIWWFEVIDSKRGLLMIERPLERWEDFKMYKINLDKGQIIGEIRMFDNISVFHRNFRIELSPDKKIIGFGGYGFKYDENREYLLYEDAFRRIFFVDIDSGRYYDLSKCVDKLVEGNLESPYHDGDFFVGWSPNRKKILFLTDRGVDINLREFDYYFNLYIGYLE